MKDPLEDQLQKEIQDFRDEKKPRDLDKKKNIGRKILYGVIGLSTLGGLIRIIIMLISK